MPSLVSAVLAGQVTTDKDTNIVSLFSVVEELGLPLAAFPTKPDERVMVPASLALYCLWSWEWPIAETPGPCEVSFQLKTAGGYEGLVNKIVSNDFAVPTERARTVAQILGFGVDIPGTYEFLIRPR